MSFTCAVGDIHGCLDKLQAMIARIETARPKGGKIIFLGDYVDRGPDSIGVLDFLMAGSSDQRWKWVILKGNHEAMMVDATQGINRTLWMENGGRETLISLGQRGLDPYVRWINSLPSIHADSHRIYVHGGVDEKVSLERQTEKTLLWKRVPDDYSGTYWGKHLVHGHTPSSSNPRTVGNRTNVDSGAVYNGKLSCAVFHDETPGRPIMFVQV